MEIKYAVNREGERHSISIKGACATDLTALIALMSGSAHPTSAPALSLVEPKIEKPVESPLPAPRPLKRSAEEIMLAVKEKSLDNAKKTIEQKVIHREHSSSISLGEIMKSKTSVVETDSTQEMYEIPDSSSRIVSDGHGGEVEVYKTKVICPSCDSTHDRFNGTANKYTKCVGCGEKLSIERAMPNFLQPDKNGYLFIASRVHQYN